MLSVLHQRHAVRWNQVPKDQQSVVLIENKIGGDFTSGGNDVDTDQLARQVPSPVNGCDASPGPFKRGRFLQDEMVLQ